jgi:hypothetical protein
VASQPTALLLRLNGDIADEIFIWFGFFEADEREGAL